MEQVGWMGRGRGGEGRGGSEGVRSEGRGSEGREARGGKENKLTYCVCTSFTECLRI